MSALDSVTGQLGRAKYLLRYEYYYSLLARFGMRCGVTRIKRDTPLIVSLTSIPTRLNKVHLCIESILRQSCRPDLVLLWLDDAVGEALPPSLLRLRKRGLVIRRCRNIRSYAKIIYTLQEHPDAIVVTADDDFFYPPRWLHDLYSAYQREPQLIHCHRAHLMALDADSRLRPYRMWDFESPGFQGPSKLLLPAGSAGVLYPVGSLAPEVHNEAVFTTICPTSDDVWLKAMSLMQGTSCKKVRRYQSDFVQIQGTQTTALWRDNVIAGHNDEHLRAVFDRYHLVPLLKE